MVIRPVIWPRRAVYTLRGCALCTLALLLTGTAPLQAAELTFGLSTRVVANDNPDLDPDTDDGGTWLRSRADLGYVTETRSTRLELGLGAGLQSGQGGDGTGVNDPVVFFDFARSAADASLSAFGQVAETDLSLGTQTGDLDETTGIRRTAVLGGRITLRDSAPFGIGLDTRLQRVTYRDDGGTQTDYDRAGLGLNARLEPNPVTRIDLRLGYALYDAADDAAQESWSFDADLGLTRALGEARAGLSLVTGDDGTRSTLTFGHTLETLRGTQGITLGVTRESDGDLSAVGGLDLQYDLPRGRLTGSLDRAVTSGEEDDAETRLTRARLIWQHQIDPRSSLQIDLSYTDSRDTGTDQRTTDQSIGATFSRELTADWALDIGLRHRSRSRDFDSDGTSSSAYIGLSRSFSMRF